MREFEEAEVIKRVWTMAGRISEPGRHLPPSSLLQIAREQVIVNHIHDYFTWSKIHQPKWRATQVVVGVHRAVSRLRHRGCNWGIKYFTSRWTLSKLYEWKALPSFQQSSLCWITVISPLLSDNDGGAESEDENIADGDDHHHGDTSSIFCHNLTDFNNDDIPDDDYQGAS